MTKIVHMKVVDGTREEIEALIKALKIIKQNDKFDFEFLVTDEKVELRDVKYLIEELYELYKKEKELKDGKN